jgi:1-pyrroline-5-carboxylate dehydrogenase
MKTEKKLTYVDLAADDMFHTEYEKALEQIQPELGGSHPVIIRGGKDFSSSEFTVLSPIDHKIVIGKFQSATPLQVRSAITASRDGFLAWSDRDWTERAWIIRKAADILDSQKFPIAALITCESGKNRYEAVAEVGEAIDMLRYHEEIYKKQNGFVIPARPENPDAESQSIMRPYGVWAIISPFNFPLSLAAGMSGAALITGNTIVLKPTSIAPFSVLKLFSVFLEAGVPPEAVQYITGPGAQFGDIITAHKDIAGIAFTGSRTAGMWLHRAFAARQRYIKPVIFEMGSKNPVIVTQHADLEKAVEGTLKSAFGFSGQKCSAASRVYVHESVAVRFIDHLRKEVENLVTGDPRDKGTFTGPLINADAEQLFRDSIEMVKKDGGRIITGGKVIGGGIFSHGHFVEPTVVSGLSRGHPLFRQELFVPILIIDAYRTLAEAVAEANSTEYGLTAGIFSENDEETEYFFTNIQSGVTYANRRGGATTGAWPGTQSFCGWKASGSTGRGVGGPFYLLSYLREQAQTRIR